MVIAIRIRGNETARQSGRRAPSRPLDGPPERKVPVVRMEPAMHFAGDSAMDHPQKEGTRDTENTENAGMSCRVRFLIRVFSVLRVQSMQCPRAATLEHTTCYIAGEAAGQPQQLTLGRSSPICHTASASNLKS